VVTTEDASSTEGDALGTAAQRPYDLLGIGFGPSNLALAVCAREQGSRLSCLFVERGDSVAWHPGMLIEGARMQISFLKDLVSLRNPASPYSFLQYAKAKGRLERFVNLNEFRLTRIEYNDYLRWVAEDFAEQVRYGTRVVRVAPAREPGGVSSLFRVETENVSSGLRATVYARNVVHAGGGRPHLPADVVEAPSVMHSSDFLRRFPAQFDDTRRPYRLAVVGGGQSAGEIAEYILDRYEHAEVNLIVTGLTLQPTDNSPFSNEQYYSENADAFYRSSATARAAVAERVRGSNYGVIREDLLDRLYHTDYMDHVKGRRRLRIHSFAHLSSVRQKDDALVATIERRLENRVEELRCDGVVLATGYDRSLDAEIFADVLPLLSTGESGGLFLSPAHRARAADELRAGLYVQGCGEAQFGIGETLLSLLPFRSREILNDIADRSPASAVGGCPAMSRRGAVGAPDAAQYPPRWYLEDDPEKLHALMERFPFATLISAHSGDEPVATHLPLILDRSRGGRGMLFGHLDGANEHARLLDGRRMLAIFHGPNAYMPPSLFDSDPLPTWNSMAVHARGSVRVIEDRDTVVRGLIGIAEHSEDGSRLRRDDPRIGRLIGGIVGFELEIDELVGRFKLSQDRDESDRRRAADALARATEGGERDFIELAVGLSLAEGAQ
jgi:lysine/ornithine N-monooxygenase/predicted FMN-binding regulatory protein PaiB